MWCRQGVGEPRIGHVRAGSNHHESANQHLHQYQSNGSLEINVNSIIADMAAAETANTPAATNDLPVLIVGSGT
jgi:hypothetical protein